MSARYTAVVAATLLGACSGAQPTHEQSALMAECVAREEQVVARDGTTEDEDREALAAIREDCDERLDATAGDEQ